MLDEVSIFFFLFKIFLEVGNLKELCEKLIFMKRELAVEEL